MAKGLRHTVDMPDSTQLTHALAADALIATVDHRASEAGAMMLRGGGTAADAAVAACAVLAVTSPHLCGLGGDLWAIVHIPGQTPITLNASGRSGGGVRAGSLRAAGHRCMPFREHLASVPVPGCVDGLLALHARFGRRPLPTVLAPALDVATNGFRATPLLSLAAPLVDHLHVDGIDASLQPGDVVRRPGVAVALAEIVAGGRDGFYLGSFGRGLLELGNGIYDEADLHRSQADWQPCAVRNVFDHRLWTTPPNSQGYLTLATLAVAEIMGLPVDDNDPRWNDILIRAALATGADRPRLLHEHADALELLSDETIAAWVRRARNLTGPLTAPTATGDTTYLAVRDHDGASVSLIASHAADFGAHVVEPTTGIFLHNRGVGFSLTPGHPAELQPRMRPPSTLSPALVTRPSHEPSGVTDEVVAVIGTMGGDSQPHLLAQHLARLLHGGAPAGGVMTAPRWVLQRPVGRGFDLWEAVPQSRTLVRFEESSDGVPPGSSPGSSSGSVVIPTVVGRWGDPAVGHLQLLARQRDPLPDGSWLWSGASECRVAESAVVRVAVEIAKPSPPVVPSLQNG